MAVPAPIPELQADSNGKLPVVPRSQIRITAAQLYGRGAKRFQIARILAPYLAPPGFRDNPYHHDSVKYVRKILRTWEHTQEFRDLIYNTALQALELEIPDIMAGVAGKAKKGRVDAARLVLEVTGRHNPKGEQQPIAITVQIANVPRP